MPKVTVNTKFFDFHQNNSGGRFVHEPKKGIGSTVIIEAIDADGANQKAENIGLYFDENGERDCTCCGSRWDKASGKGIVLVKGE